MADTFHVRRASLSPEDRPAATFWTGLGKALARLPWQTSKTDADIAEAERLLALSDAELQDLGLTRGEIYNYVYGLENQDRAG